MRSALNSSAVWELTAEDVSYEREAVRTDPYGPQEMATQARQASRRHYLCYAISCRSNGLLSSELSLPEKSEVLSKGSKWVLHTLV